MVRKEDDICQVAMQSECLKYFDLWPKCIKMYPNQVKFSKPKTETKMLKFQNCPKGSPKEHYKNYVYQVSMQSED